MDTKSNAPSDFERVNALVDGELSAGERADIAARMAHDRSLVRVHATLAHLKASIGEIADEAPAPPLALRVKRSWRLRTAVGGAAALVGVALLFANYDVLPDKNGVPAHARDAMITLAGLPAKPMIPDLAAAGLKLSDVDVDRSGLLRILAATYLGRHGCRLDLRVWPSGADVPPKIGTSRRVWTSGELTYELIAHGMPGWRFTLIAESAEQETRGSGAGHRLREARTGAPPCAS